MVTLLQKYKRYRDERIMQKIVISPTYKPYAQQI